MKFIKKIFLFLFLLLIFSCKSDSEKKIINETIDDTLEIGNDTLVDSNQNIELKKQQSIQIKRQELIKKDDERVELEELVVDKSFYKESDFYTLDFKYPYLNESLNPSYINFNEYIQKYYIDIKGVEAQILEDKELYCDEIGTNACREKRIVEYKIYSINEKLISVLFYKENYYSGAMHPSYMFDCLNFDLNRSVFMNYEDFFNNGSEEELRAILNDLLKEKIASGEFFYDCWQISEDDFFDSKNNFVVDDTFVEFYFDDCVICPSYTGTYSIKIPLVTLLPVLRKYKLNPLIS